MGFFFLLLFSFRVHRCCKCDNNSLIVFPSGLALLGKFHNGKSEKALSFEYSRSHGPLKSKPMNDLMGNLKSIK